MNFQYDTVIRGGLVADGTGAAPGLADIAITGGLIQAVGHIQGRGIDEIDATGLLVTPGSMSWESAARIAKWHTRPILTGLRHWSGRLWKEDRRIRPMQSRRANIRSPIRLPGF